VGTGLNLGGSLVDRGSLGHTTQVGGAQVHGHAGDRGDACRLRHRGAAPWPWPSRDPHRPPRTHACVRRTSSWTARRSLSLSLSRVLPLRSGHVHRLTTLSAASPPSAPLVCHRIRHRTHAVLRAPPALPPRRHRPRAPDGRRLAVHPALVLYPRLGAPRGPPPSSGSAGGLKPPSSSSRPRPSRPPPPASSPRTPRAPPRRPPPATRWPPAPQSSR